MSSKPSRKPMTGELNMGTMTLRVMPFTSSAPTPAETMVAPSRPPMSACDEELGMPNHQVSRFQAMAPSSAAATTASVVVSTSTRPAPIVVATAVPAKAPMKLNAAAMRTAFRGVNARVATDVAIALAESWKPLM
jgi:hypothetical protein